MNNLEVLKKWDRFLAARAVTDIIDIDAPMFRNEGSTDPYIVRAVWKVPPALMYEPEPDEAPASGFDVLDELRTPQGQIRGRITAFRRGAASGYHEDLARRLDFLLGAVEEEGEIWAEHSPDSLRQMLLFLQATPDLRCPTVTITPSMTFRAQWEAGPDRLFALDFLPDGQVRFVVFSPDRRYPARAQRVSGIVSRVDVMSAVEPYQVARWSADAGA